MSDPGCSACPGCRVTCARSWPAPSPRRKRRWTCSRIGSGTNWVRSPAAAERVGGLFAYRIARELGSLAAALGGIDALVFTGGIGEHAAPIRARVCHDAAWLGVTLDEAANAQHGPRISRPGARVSAWVIPTDENRMV